MLTALTKPSKGAATRELILARAVELADRSGLDALTIGTLAEAAGMSKSGVFAHFGSREDLQLAVLDAAAKIFTDEVFVPAVPGNHGRTTKRVQAKRFAAKNIDWLVYILLEKYFAEMGDDRVQIYAPETGEALFRIYSHRFLCLHGHDLGVKGGDGILGALGPIARGAMKVANSQSQIGRDFDMLLLGHWHQSLQLPRVIVANSLKGYDEFARSFLRAGFSVPSQPLFFVHPKHGITARWEILLEEREIAAEREWISWKAA